jgi:hypothetical protein
MAQNIPQLIDFRTLKLGKGYFCIGLVGTLKHTL